MRRHEIAKRKKDEIAKEIYSMRETHAIAGKIIGGLRDASLNLTLEKIEAISPIFQSIYSRIEPHPTFKVTKMLAKMRNGKGRLQVGVSDPDLGENAQDALSLLSSSQLNSFAVSLFLALNLSLPSFKLQATMLDDPLQNLDSINLLGLVDVLRRFREHRQIIVSTHEPRLLGLLQRKLRPVDETETLSTITFEGWSKQGPKVKFANWQFNEGEAYVLESRPVLNS